LQQAFADTDYKSEQSANRNQLNLYAL
jgi:hypothetical protein